MKTILFIDDDLTVLMVGEIILKSLGYNLKTASSGNEGIELIDKNIDLILLDLMLPDLYGLEVLEYIKKSKDFSKIPVIIQTGINDKGEIDKAYKLGASAVLFKPYNKEQLDKMIKAHL
jgi:CheY-like chemotaxis protein